MGQFNFRVLWQLYITVKVLLSPSCFQCYMIILATLYYGVPQTYFVSIATLSLELFSHTH